MFLVYPLYLFNSLIFQKLRKYNFLLFAILTVTIFYMKIPFSQLELNQRLPRAEKFVQAIISCCDGLYAVSNYKDLVAKVNATVKGAASTVKGLRVRIIPRNPRNTSFVNVRDDVYKGLPVVKVFLSRGQQCNCHFILDLRN